MNKLLFIVLFIFLSLSISCASVQGEGLLEEDAQNYYQQAFETYQKGKSQEAISLFQKAALLNPGLEKNSCNNIGVIYAAIGQFDKAEENFKAALAAAPHYQLAQVNLGLLYEESGRKDLANRWWLKIFDLAKQRPGRFSAVALSDADYSVKVGLDNADLSQYAQARSQFQKALKLDPGNKTAQANMALVYEKENQPQEALKWWAEFFDIEKLKPKDFIRIAVPNEIWHTKEGLLAIDTRDFERAEGSFLMALAANPDFKPAQINLALTYEKLGEPDKANRWWVKAFDLDKKHSNDFALSEEDASPEEKMGK